MEARRPDDERQAADEIQRMPGECELEKVAGVTESG